MSLRFRRRSLRFNRQPAQKNYNQAIGNAVAINVAANLIAVVNASGTPDGISQVDYPATVKMFYIDYTLAHDAIPAVVPEVVVAIWKNPGNNMTVPTPANLLALGNWTGVSQVFFVAQGSPGVYAGDNNQLRIRGWIRIPRRHQVMNEGDRIYISAGSNNAATVTICNLNVYKWRA